MSLHAIALDPDQKDTAPLFRRGMSGLVMPDSNTGSRTGFLDNGGYISAGSGMNASFPGFRAYIDAGNNQGGWFVMGIGSTSVTFDNGSTQDRHDLVYVQVTNQPASNTYKVQAKVAKGASGGGLPTAPGYSIRIADALVPAGANSASQITFNDLRRRTVATGGVIPVPDASALSQLSTASQFRGTVAFQVDTDTLWVLKQSGWDKVQYTVPAPTSGSLLRPGGWTEPTSDRPPTWHQAADGLVVCSGSGSPGTTFTYDPNDGIQHSIGPLPNTIAPDSPLSFDIQVIGASPNIRRTQVKLRPGENQFILSGDQTFTATAGETWFHFAGIVYYPSDD